MKELFKRCVDKWGRLAQLIMVMEECAELIKEVSKEIRGKGNRKNIIEEIADVQLMIEQLKFMLNITDEEITDATGEKIERLETLLGIEELKGIKLKEKHCPRGR